ncbi:MAG: M1 family peptidase, partial [Flavipsychrobacter sp.]
MNRISFFVTIMVWYLLKANTTFAYSRQDTLRGTNGSGRSWWDVTKYELNISFDTATQSIHGYVDMKFKLVQHTGDSMQLDLQEPMVMDSIMSSVGKLLFVREGNVLWVNTRSMTWQNESVQQLRLYYHGSPRKAKMPPWDGGFIWAYDSTGKPWIAVACQGLGASVWWPCKDYQGDEPDSGARMTFDMGQMQEMVVSNGRELAAPVHENTASSNIWAREVQNPINTYDITFYIGDYISWQDTIMGEKGKLDLSFYALRYNEAKARKQFAVVKQMLHCFEYWMGP